MSGADFAALLPDVARRLLGDPPRATDAEWRYGRHGSLSVHPARGTWHDFEADAGGGALALIEHVNGCDKAGALAWLVGARLIDPPAGPDARPAAARRPAATCPPAPNRPATAESGPAAPRSLPESSVRRPVRRPPAQGGTWTRPESAGRADGAGAAPSADVAAAILAAAVPADDTPARAYLAARGTWPADGPPLPAAVRWLPPGAWEHLPTWPGRDGRPLRLTPPADGIRSLRPGAAPVSRCGALVYELTRPGCAPDAAQLEPVTADGRRLEWPGRGGTKRTPGNNGAARVLEVAAPPGDGWPDAGAAPLVVAVVESPGNALALARLRLPGVLIRAAAGTGGLRAGGAALVADLPAAPAACLVSDGDPPGRAAVVELHAALQNAGRTCYAALLRGGADLDDVLRGADDADLRDRHAERAAILELDGGLPRPAATARALARLIEQLPRRTT